MIREVEPTMISMLLPYFSSSELMYIFCLCEICKSYSYYNLLSKNLVKSGILFITCQTYFTTIWPINNFHATRSNPCTTIYMHPTLSSLCKAIFKSPTLANCLQERVYFAVKLGTHTHTYYPDYTFVPSESHIDGTSLHYVVLFYHAHLELGTKKYANPPQEDCQYSKS